jgi:predicted nucleic acid-binding Zn ribbon protein
LPSDDRLRRVRPKPRTGADRTSEPEGIGVVLAALGASRPLAAGLSLGRLGRAWPSVVGERLAVECEPASLEQGVLVVRVSSAAWATHVKFLAEEIGRRANEALGGRSIREVRVVLGGPKTG